MVIWDGEASDQVSIISLQEEYAGFLACDKL